MFAHAQNFGVTLELEQVMADVKRSCLMASKTAKLSTILAMFLNVNTAQMQRREVQECYQES